MTTYHFKINQETDIKLLWLLKRPFSLKQVDMMKKTPELKHFVFINLKKTYLSQEPIACFLDLLLLLKQVFLGNLDLIKMSNLLKLRQNKKTNLNKLIKSRMIF